MRTSDVAQASSLLLPKRGCRLEARATFTVRSELRPIQLAGAAGFDNVGSLTGNELQTHLMKATATAFLMVVAGLVVGCASKDRPRDFVPTTLRFFLESTSQDGTPLTLPQSGVSMMVNSRPILTEGDIVNVELVQVELGKCLFFQLSPSATRDFYRISVAHQGRRLALMIDNVALGARRVDGPITNGVVFVFVELPDDALPALVEKLKKSSGFLQGEIKRKG